VGPEELALERHELLGEELVDQLGGLLEPGETFLLLGPLDAEWDLVERLSGAEAQHDPALGAGQPDGRERLGDDRRVVAERRVRRSSRS
jgi:hypothetical protein